MAAAQRFAALLDPLHHLSSQISYTAEAEEGRLLTIIEKVQTENCSADDGDVAAQSKSVFYCIRPSKLALVSDGLCDEVMI